MKIMLVLIVIVFIVAILLFIGIIKGMSGFSAPNKESDSIAAVKRFLDFDFGNEYEVIENISKNHHHDRPLKISVKLLGNAIDITNSYITGLSLVTTESISEEKNTHKLGIKLGTCSKKSILHLILIPMKLIPLFSLQILRLT